MPATCSEHARLVTSSRNGPRPSYGARRLPDAFARSALDPDWPDGIPNSTLRVLEFQATDADAEAALWTYLFGIDLVGTVVGRSERRGVRAHRPRTRSGPRRARARRDPPRRGPGVDVGRRRAGPGADERCLAARRPLLRRAPVAVVHDALLMQDERGRRSCAIFAGCGEERAGSEWQVSRWRP